MSTKLAQMPVRRAFWVIGGIVGPLACLGIEGAGHLCRESLFDPIPTRWHALLILLVPVATFLALRAIDQPARRTRWLGILFGCSTCTTLLYSIPFVPFLPLSIVMVVCMGIGLLGLAPLAAPAALLSMAAEFRTRAGEPGETRLPRTWTGFLGCILLLGLLDIGPVRTILKVRGQWTDLTDEAGARWLREHGDRSMLEELARGTKGFRPVAFFVRTWVHIGPGFVRDNWSRFTGEPLPYSLVERSND